MQFEVSGQTPVQKVGPSQKPPSVAGPGHVPVPAPEADDRRSEAASIGAVPLEQARLKTRQGSAISSLNIHSGLSPLGHSQGASPIGAAVTTILNPPLYLVGLKQGDSLDLVGGIKGKATVTRLNEHGFSLELTLDSPHPLGIPLNEGFKEQDGKLLVTVSVQRKAGNQYNYTLYDNNDGRKIKTAHEGELVSKEYLETVPHNSADTEENHLQKLSIGIPEGALKVDSRLGSKGQLEGVFSFPGLPSVFDSTE